MFPFPGTTDWVQGAITGVACRNRGPTSSFPKEILKRQLKEENEERERGREEEKKKERRRRRQGERKCQGRTREPIGTEGTMRGISVQCREKDKPTHIWLFASPCLCPL